MPRLHTYLALWGILATSTGAPLGAQQTITLSTGDQISGTLDSIAGQSWIVRYFDAKVKIPASDIAGLVTDEGIDLRLSDSSVVAAAAVARSPDGLLLMLPDGTARTVQPTEIVAVGSAARIEMVKSEIGLFSPITRFWGATGSVGYSDKSGNSRARGMAFAMDLERKTARDRLNAGIAVNRESSRPPDGAFQATVEKYQGYLRSDIYLVRTFFVFGQTRQEHDRFQDLALRSTYTGGLGFQAIATAFTDLRFWGSAGFRHERYIANGTASSAVAVAGYQLGRQLGPAKLAWKVEATPSLEDVADYRVTSDASLTTAIYRGFGVRIGAVNEFNNRPRPGVRKHDLLLTTTLTYSIGKR